MKKDPWYIKNVKKNIYNLKSYSLRIELAKYSLEQKWGLFRWVLLVGISVLLSVKILDLPSSEIQTLHNLGIAGYIIGLVFIFISIIIHILEVHANIKSLTWLYQQKDKSKIK